jgi:hypothetical protein
MMTWIVAMKLLTPQSLAQCNDDYIDPLDNKAEEKNSGEQGTGSVQPNGHRPGRKT